MQKLQEHAVAQFVALQGGSSRVRLPMVSFKFFFDIKHEGAIKLST
jgi:hypothetical protein